MDRSEIQTKVNQLFHEGFEIPMESLQPSSHIFKDLGLDSLDAVDLMVHLEERLGVRVDSEVFQNVRTLDDVYNTVDMLLKKGPVKTS